MKDFNTIKISGNKEASERLIKEAERLLKTFDYTNYDGSIYRDDDNEIFIIPTPVYAVALANDALIEEIENTVECFPSYTVKIVDEELLPFFIDDYINYN